MQKSEMYSLPQTSLNWKASLMLALFSMLMGIAVLFVLGVKVMHRKLFIATRLQLNFLGIFGIAKASFMPIKAIIGQHYLEAAWQESLKNNRLSKPWRSADFYMIGELKVPRLKISRVILNSVSGEAMAWGIGLVTNIGIYQQAANHSCRAS